MFIAFNNLPHCAPTERHVYVMFRGYKHVAPPEQIQKPNTKDQVKHTRYFVPGCLCFAPEEQDVYSFR
jgi:hypothetical protein